MLRRPLVGLLALGFSTGCATAQLERDIKVIRDELDSLRADYKRQSRDVEFLTARVLTMNAQKQQVAQKSVRVTRVDVDDARNDSTTGANSTRNHATSGLSSASSQGRARRTRASTDRAYHGGPR